MQIIDDEGIPTVVLNGTNHVIEKLNPFLLALPDRAKMVVFNLQPACKRSTTLECPTPAFAQGISIYPALGVPTKGLS